jgi:hypothetical protein
MARPVAMGRAVHDQAPLSGCWMVAAPPDFYFPALLKLYQILQRLAGSSPSLQS